jgi:hypothetical protein
VSFLTANAEKLTDNAGAGPVILVARTGLRFLSLRGSTVDRRTSRLHRRHHLDVLSVEFRVVPIAVAMHQAARTLNLLKSGLSVVSISPLTRLCCPLKVTKLLSYV